MKARWFARVIAIGYLTLLIVLPTLLVVRNAFGSGVGQFWEALTKPEAISAFVLTVKIVAIAVPLNTIFGVICALVLVRQRFFGSSLLGAIVNVPVAISPVVVGLSLFIIYGRGGWLGTWFVAHHIQVIFAVPGMVLATIFISLPFVVREVIPVLREIGTEQEQAASTLGATPLQTFWRITLPAIRTGVAYGVVLTTARALGEFGAVSIVSGRLEGQTQTLTLYVQDRFEQFDLVGAYSASVVLALLALAVLGMMSIVGRRIRPDGN
jgi:sulfate transport system permease protein